MVYYNDEWNFQLCITVNVHAENAITAKVKCDCSVPGFIGVGLVIDNTYVNNSIKEIFHYDQNVTFKLVSQCNHFHNSPKTICDNKA